MNYNTKHEQLVYVGISTSGTRLGLRDLIFLMVTEGGKHSIQHLRRLAKVHTLAAIHLSLNILFFLLRFCSYIFSSNCSQFTTVL